MILIERLPEPAKDFERLLRGLRERQIHDGRDSLAPEEKEAMENFKETYHAFSLMFRIYLSNVNLQVSSQEGHYQ